MSAPLFSERTAGVLGEWRRTSATPPATTAAAAATISTSRYMPFQPVTHVPKHGPELYFVAVLIDWVDDCDSATVFGLQWPPV